MKKEINEILECEGKDVIEWCDVILLCIDGAQRQGFTPEQISKALFEKQQVNKNRKWPDWKNSEDKPLEHLDQ